MQTLTEFLLERIDEDESLAQAAIDAHRIDHTWDHLAGPDGALFARWNPWRVLSACVAKRLIIAAHRDIGAGIDGRADSGQALKAHVCSTCGQFDQYAIEWPCYTLRLLALDWVDHPSYRREWRPRRLNSGVERAPERAAPALPAAQPATTPATTPATAPVTTAPLAPPRQRPGAA